jgi:hypothetical protein
MTLALHSSSLLFSVLQNLLKANRRHMRITSLVRASLLDWLSMLTEASSHPVPIMSLVPHAPHYIGATDASKDGMGGWWVPTTIASDTQPYVWRQAWPPGAAQHIVSTTNMSGNLNNSELELTTAVIGHATILHSMPTMPYRSVYQGIDNTAAQAWISRGNTPDSPAPSQLLRALARDNRKHCSRLSAFYIPGVSNSLSDLLSRSFHLLDAALLDKIHPVAPSQQPWQFGIPSEHWASKPNSWLSSTLPNKQFLLENPVGQTQPGQHGHISATLLTKTPGSNHLMIPRPSSRSLLIATEWERWLPQDLRLRLERWKQPFVLWARRSPSWDSLTPVCRHQENWTYAYTANSRSTLNRTPPPTRVKPIPLQVLQLAVQHCYHSTHPEAHAIVHMLILGCFFLLRPGEYAHTTNERAAPFRLCDVHLIAHNQHLDPLTCPKEDLHLATYVALEFTTQKNGVR